MNAWPEKIPDILLQRAERLSPALLSDAMLGRGIPQEGTMAAEIFPINPKLTMVGTACTVKTSDGDNLPVHIALYTAKPDYVMVIDGESYNRRPCLGGLMAFTGKAVGLKGIIVDGLIRDMQECRDLDFPIYARGYMQRPPVKKDLGKINVPISCGGISVSPGDLVVGDGDGVTVVPRDRIEEILMHAEAKQKYEEARHDKISEYMERRISGQPLFDLTPPWLEELLGEDCLKK